MIYFPFLSWWFAIYLYDNLSSLLIMVCRAYYQSNYGRYYIDANMPIFWCNVNN